MARQRSLRAYSARTHLAFFGLAVALPLIGALGGFLSTSIQHARATTEQRVLQTLNDVVDNLERDLERDLTLLNTLARSSFLRQADWKAFHAQAREALQGQTYLVLSDMDGRQLVNTFVPHGQEPQTTGDPDTVRRIAEDPRPVFSDLFTSKVVRRPVLNISIPVMKDGRPQYVMSLAVLPEDLNRILKDVALDANWTFTIWDAQGRIVARTRDFDRLVGTVLPARLRPIEKQRQVVRVADLDGAPALRAVAISPLSGWGVAATVSAESIDRQVRAAGWWLGAAVAAVVLIAFGLSYMVSLWLAAPLAEVAAAAIALGRREPPHTTPSRVREVNAVADALQFAHGAIEAEHSALASSEAHKTLLLDELTHRVKNTLAVIQALAGLTFRPPASTPAVLEAFQGRVRALARAHEVLARGQWQDASIAEVVSAAIEPYDRGRFEVDGPAVVISSKACLAITLGLNELCTNSVKHGALGAAEGRVKIGWSLSATPSPHVKLHWQELNGPPVREPLQRGFGTTLLRGAVAADLQGTVEIAYAPDGVTCVIDFPVTAPLPP